MRNRIGRLAIALAALTMVSAVAGEASAVGVRIDPNGRSIDQGSQIDPNGRGWGIDPNGREAGSQMDPDGRDDGASIDPNGRGWGIDPNGRGLWGWLKGLFGWR